MKPTAEKLDALVNLLKENMTSYYCKWCKRHLQAEEYKHGAVYIHDDVFHPDNYSQECGGEHRVH
uniref:Uncharacterized protein n=1 Tax=viral metagenome TaxID=1070528 RepID=A0A6M3KD19_9ZZZZ